MSESLTPSHHLIANTEKHSSSSKNTSNKRKCTSNDRYDVCNVSDVSSMLSALSKEKDDLESALVRVEFFDVDGNSLWSCDDLRQGRQNKLHVDDELPSLEEEGVTYWRRHVWTLPVPTTKNGRTEFVLTQADQIKEVRVGLYSWKPQIGKDVGLNFEYNSKKQTYKLTLPLICAGRKDTYFDLDKLGPTGLYLTGTSTVTSPYILERFDKDDSDSAWDHVRDVLPAQQEFPGVHDELRVREVHLSLSGIVYNTLKFFNLVHNPPVEKGLLNGSLSLPADDE